MKNKNGIYIIGVDHGYGNIKTANSCFPTGVESSDTEPTFKNDLLIYQGRYYQIGVGHKEYVAEKVMDEDYYILTLAAIARELSREQITQANVFLAAGLPLSWVAKQRKAFQTYLLQKSTPRKCTIFSPPYSNVVPAPESHWSVASLISSQSHIPFSGGYSLVKLHGFPPPISIFSILW